MFKDENDFKKIVDRLKIDTEPNLAHREKLRRQMLTAFEEEQPAGRTIVFRTLRRTIMRSPLTKLAAAAAIIIAVLIIINQFGGSIDGTTVAFAQITQNMKNMPWLHVIVESASDKLEVWFSFERRVMIQKTPDGKISYQDDLKRIKQVFDPDANTVMISPCTTDSLAAIGHTALDFPNSVLKLFDETKDNITQETSKYKGKDAIVYRMRGFVGGMDMKIKMVVDKDENILLFLNQKAFNEDGTLKIEANGYFDYPENGPNNIFEASVPKSAKIVRVEKENIEFEKAFEKAITIIDNQVNWPEPRELVIKYWKARNAKNYDELAILWPGSATWNRKVLENEEAIEYVFGEVQTTETKDQIFIPYATKSYFEKYGKYSLKMWLANKESTKRRYYILSGN